MAKTAAQRIKAMRDRRKAAGVCIDCGGDVEPDNVQRGGGGRGRPRHARCKGCTETMIARKEAHYAARYGSL